MWSVARPSWRTVFPWFAMVILFIHNSYLVFYHPAPSSPSAVSLLAASPSATPALPSLSCPTCPKCAQQCPKAAKEIVLVESQLYLLPAIIGPQRF